MNLQKLLLSTEDNVIISGYFPPMIESCSIFQLDLICASPEPGETESVTFEEWEI